MLIGPAHAGGSALPGQTRPNHMPTKMPELIPTRQSLLLNLKDLGDDQSWREFFETYSDLLYSIAKKAGLSAAEADDVVQETVIAVARKMVTFDYRTSGSFKAWLLNLARWRIIDQFRKRSRSEPPVGIPEVDPSESPDWQGQFASNDFETMWDDEWGKQLLNAAVEQARKQVSAKQFQIFQLNVLDRWEVEQVKSTLGVSTTQVYLARHRVGAVVKAALRRIEKGLI